MSEHIPEWITNLAADTYKIIQQYKALPHFQEMVNTWAESHEAEINNLRKWREHRALHFEETIATDVRLQNEQTGPPGDGWQFQNHVQHTEKQTESGLQRSHNIIQGWVPPELATRPELTQILPLNRDHALSLVEKYTVLAAIYDYGRKGTDKLPPWEWPDLSKQQTPQAMSDAKKCISFEALSRSLADLVPADEDWLRIMLDDVEADVAEWAGLQLPHANEQANGAVSETRTDRYIRRLKDQPFLSILYLIILGIIVVGTVAGSIYGIIILYDRIAGQQGKDQIKIEKVEDKPIVTAAATVEIIIRSEEKINKPKRYLHSEAVLAFGKGTEALLQLSSKESTAKQMGIGEVRYSSELDMKVTDKAFKQPLSLLQQVEYAQLRFDIIPPNSQVLSGTVVCIFNNNIPIELSVPSQKMYEKLIVIPNIDIAEALRKHTESK